ncbi:MAG: hypothetical protein JWP39_1242, partial [Jatrophihabitans sp.]|nr:hypothetical protein [Jatrophihabitans sp.]
NLGAAGGAAALEGELTACADLFSARTVRDLADTTRAGPRLDGRQVRPAEEARLTSMTVPLVYPGSVTR